MYFNGQRTRSESEMTVYQKKIESMDTVILCVAEAERLVHVIGKDLFPEVVKRDKSRSTKPERKKAPWADRRNHFKW
jgi:hypothetical protein